MSKPPLDEKAALSFRVDATLKKRLEALAKADKRPLSHFLELHLEQIAARLEAPKRTKK